MLNKGCNDCIHYKHAEIKVYTNDIPSKCLLGNDAEFQLWWKENGEKKNKEELIDMPCFKETQISKSINKMIKIINEIHKEI